MSRLVQSVIHLFTLICFFVTCLNAWSANLPSYKQAPVTQTQQRHIEQNYRFPVSPDALREVLDLDKRYRFTLLKEGADSKAGTRYSVFQQFIDDIRVYEKTLTVTYDANGKLLDVIGDVVRVDESKLPLPVKLSEAEALARAKQMFNELSGDGSNKRVAETTSIELVIYLNPRQKGVIAYAINFFIDNGENNAIHPYIVMDANTAEVLATWRKAIANKQQAKQQAAEHTSSIEDSHIRVKHNISGQEAIDALGDNLPIVAERYQKTAQQLRALLLKDRSLRVDAYGNLFYQDEFKHDHAHIDAHPQLVKPHRHSLDSNPVEEAMPKHLIANANANANVMSNELSLHQSTSWQALPDTSQAFQLSSRPYAAKTIYLDFDGHILSNTIWNSVHARESITQAPFSLDNDPRSFNEEERQFIIEVWRAVADFYAPFDINVTTNSPSDHLLTRTESADATYGAHVVISGSNSALFCNGCVGKAYINVFGRIDRVGAYLHALVFSDRLPNALAVALTAAHEVGHQLGLDHDGSSVQEYYEGHGLWGPIMGSAIGKSITQWSKGEYSDANNRQDDLAIIAGKVSYLADDHGNTFADATDVTGISNDDTELRSFNALIERTGDVDFFKFNADNNGILKITITPAANTLHAQAKLFDSEGVLVASAESVDSAMGAGALQLSKLLGGEQRSGEAFYLSVTGVGSGDALTGYTDYGSIGNYRVDIGMSTTQSITARLPERAAVGKTEWIEANVDSKLPLHFESQSTDICQIVSSVADKAMVEYLQVGQCRISVRQDGTDTLSATEKSFSFPVKYEQILSPTSVSDRLVSAGSFILPLSVSSNRLIALYSYPSINAGACNISWAAYPRISVEVLGSGTCQFRMAVAGDENYWDASLDLRFYLRNNMQQIVFPEIEDRMIGATAPFAISATTQSSSPVLFKSLTPDVCKIDDRIVTLVAAGICTIAADAARDSNYLAAEQVTRSFTVYKETPTLQIDADFAITFGDPPFTVNAVDVKGRAISYRSLTEHVCTMQGGVVSILAAGDCVVRAAAPETSLYNESVIDKTIPIAKAIQFINVDALPDQIPFSTVPVTLHATATSSAGVVFSSTTPAVCRVENGTQLYLEAQGTCELIASAAADNNYLAMEITHSIEVLADTDGDGIADVDDNCPAIANPRQLDFNGNGIGDACNDFLPMPESMSGESKADQLGAVVSFVGDFNGDGYGDYAVALPGFDIQKSALNKKAIKDVGQVRVISGLTGEALHIETGSQAKEGVGIALAGNADINNDGYSDIVIGIPRYDVNGLKDAGRVVIVYGGVEPAVSYLDGSKAKSLFGSAVSLADVNNDRFADILVGAPKDNHEQLKFAGSVTVYSGAQPSIVLNKYFGTQTKAFAGTSVAGANVDGIDGAEIIVGAANDDDMHSGRVIDTGSVKVYRVVDPEPLASYYGNVAKAYLGSSLAVGDVNADGFDDVVAGAPGDDNGKLKNTGSVTVFYGNGALPLWKVYGDNKQSEAGNAVAVADVNADGFDDVIIGASKFDKPKLKDVGSVSIWDVRATTRLDFIYGGTAKDGLGSSVSAGDINGDGHADILIGVPSADHQNSKKIKDVGQLLLLDGSLY